VFLHQSNEALKILESGVLDIHTSPGWRAARMADLAAAYAQRADADRAVSVLLEAADIAIGARDPWRLRRVKGVRQTQIPANYTSEALGELDNKLAGAVPN
jgi:hypothetical protein